MCRTLIGILDIMVNQARAVPALSWLAVHWERKHWTADFMVNDLFTAVVSYISEAQFPHL